MTGDTLWTRTYGGSWDDEAKAVVVDGAGNYIVIGYSKSFNDEYKADLYILKLDTAGDTIWTRHYDRVGDHDYGFGIAVDSEGYYIAVGGTWGGGSYDDGWVLKLDPTTGDTLWSRIYTGGGGETLFDLEM